MFTHAILVILMLTLLYLQYIVTRRMYVIVHSYTLHIIVIIRHIINRLRNDTSLVNDVTTSAAHVNRLSAIAIVAQRELADRLTEVC